MTDNNFIILYPEEIHILQKPSVIESVACSIVNNNSGHFQSEVGISNSDESKNIA